MSREEARWRDPRAGDRLGGRYELLRIVGRGGMGLVYAARELKTARVRAVKVLQGRYCGDPAWVERFRRESTTTALLHHENIVEVFDFGETADGQPWFAMEWLAGETLDATLRREGPLRWARVVGVARQICDALVVAHHAGVIHRDLKLTNCVRISRSGDPDFVKILDFGIAKTLHHPAPILTPTGIGFGTPGYAAPEQFDGRIVDETSDIYAVGVILYQLLAGCMPFAGASLAEILSKQMTRAPRRIRDLVPDSDVPAQVEDAILSTLIPDPSRRPATMDTLREILTLAPTRPVEHLTPQPSDGAASSRPSLPDGGVELGAEVPRGASSIERVDEERTICHVPRVATGLALRSGRLLAAPLLLVSLSLLLWALFPNPREEARPRASPGAAPVSSDEAPAAAAREPVPVERSPAPSIEVPLVPEIAAAAPASVQVLPRPRASRVRRTEASAPPLVTPPVATVRSLEALVAVFRRCACEASEGFPSELSLQVERSREGGFMARMEVQGDDRRYLSCKRELDAALQELPVMGASAALEPLECH